jgi:hypothetical protein
VCRVDHEREGVASGRGDKQAVVLEPVDRSADFSTCSVIVAGQVLLGQAGAREVDLVGEVEHVAEVSSTE